MTRLPVLSGREVVKALSRIGYYVRDQREATSIFAIPRGRHLPFQCIAKSLEGRCVQSSEMQA